MDRTSLQTRRRFIQLATYVCATRGSDWVRKMPISWNWIFSHELPQALFQLGLLLFGEASNDDKHLIWLSVAISLSSLFLQIIQLRAVAKKESYPSMFSLVVALFRGEFISGVNKIKENTSSVLNVILQLFLLFDPFVTHCVRILKGKKSRFLFRNRSKIIRLLNTRYSAIRVLEQSFPIPLFFEDSNFCF